MVKEYNYLVVYQASLFSGAVLTSSTSFTTAVDEYFEDDEFYNVAWTYAEGAAKLKHPHSVSNVVILNIINLTKMKPIMEV